MRVRRPTLHPASTTGIIVAIAGLALVIPGAITLNSPTPPDYGSGGCDICGFTYGWGKSMSGWAMTGVGIFHLVLGTALIAVGATRPSVEVEPARGDLSYIKQDGSQSTVPPSPW